MTDRELLELAAKAAGYDYMPQNRAIVKDGIPANWNPLEDDGDALRLAVSLRIEISPEGFSLSRVDARCRWGTWLMEMYRNHDGDPYSATRRAIVSAAAEIGRLNP